jgi:hypothetical protein
MTKTEKQTILTWLQAARKDYEEIKALQGNVSLECLKDVFIETQIAEATYNTLAGLASILGLISPSERFKED